MPKGQMKHRSGGWGSAGTALRCLWCLSHLSPPCDRCEVDACLDGDLSSGCQYAAEVAELLDTFEGYTIDSECWQNGGEYLSCFNTVLVSRPNLDVNR